jgi:hypothetical protein
LDALKRVSEEGASGTADFDAFKCFSGEGTPGTGELDAFRRLSGSGNFDFVCDRITVEQRYIGIDRGLGGSSYGAMGADIGKDSEADGKCGGENED